MNGNSNRGVFAPLVIVACAAACTWPVADARAGESCFPTGSVRLKPSPSATLSAPMQRTPLATVGPVESVDKINNAASLIGTSAIGKQVGSFPGTKALGVPAAVVNTYKAYENAKVPGNRSGYEQAEPSLEAMRATAGVASAAGKIPKGAYALTSVAVDASKAGLAMQKIADSNGNATADDYGRAVTHSVDAVVKATLAVGGAKVFRNNAGADRAVAAYEGAQYLANAAVESRVTVHFVEVDAQIDAQSELELTSKMQAALARRAARTGTAAPQLFTPSYSPALVIPQRP